MVSVIHVNNRNYVIRTISKKEAQAINNLSTADQQKALLNLIIGKKLELSDFDGRLNCLVSLTNKIKELINNGK